ncbi:MAG: hypothetical protein R6V46_02100 [Desulfatiglandaceae bacterium]
MKLRLKAFVCFGSIVYFLLSSYGFGQVSAPMPQLHQENPRPIGKGLMRTENYHLGPVIPGLQQGAVPQGLAYSAKHNLIFISFYFDKPIPSSVSVIDGSTKKCTGTFALKESASVHHYGHVGGIAVNDAFVWVSSDGKLHKYALSDATTANTMRELTPMRVTATETNASFVTFYKNRLFVGEFAYGSKYKTKKSHHTEDRTGQKQSAWICAYNTNEAGNTFQYILSIREKVQGICITDDQIFLSISYGRRNRSTIAVYENPLGEQPHRNIALDSGRTVPLWYLDGKNLIKEIDFPPMSEGVTMINGKLAVLSESGAEKYQRGGLGPLDYIIFIDLEEYFQNSAASP